MKTVISGLCVWLVIIALLPGCANSPNVSDKENSSDGRLVIGKSLSSIDFLNVCRELNHFIGSSEKVEEGLFPGPFVVANCNDSRKDSFSLIFRCKDYVGVARLNNLFSKGKENNYKDFYVYAFVSTRLSKEEDADLQETTDVFPSMYRVYKRVNESWVYSGEEQVNNMAQYIRFIKKTLNAPHVS